mmetsp:Transcript_92702/g.177962  ORF Transcript_92702/g.177962 Transcript_92702/m.177962 type:complete len:651 (-) Transcript_92702:66-2018(-)
MGPWHSDPAPGSLASEPVGKSSPMALLTREDLRLELLRSPLVTEPCMRSALREELADLSTVVQHALRLEARRFLGEWSELLPKAAGRSADANDSGCCRGGSQRGRPLTSPHLNGNSFGQQAAEVHKLWDAKLHPELRSPMDRDMMRQISVVSPESVESTPVHREVPPMTPPTMFLPGAMLSPKVDRLREAGDDCTPVISIRNPVQHNGHAPPPNPSSPLTVREADVTATMSERKISNNNKVIMSSKIQRRASNTPKVTVFSEHFFLRRLAKHIVSHSIFDYVVAALILVNGIIVGVQTHYLAEELSDDTPWFFQVLEVVFCVLFTVELCLRLVAYQCAFFTMSGKGWNLFDLFVVTAQIFEILMSVLASGLGFSFRLLRVLRLIRVIRLARALRLIGELRTIVSSIVSSMKPLFWTGVLLFMVVYVLGVYTTQVVLTRRISYREDNEEPPPALEKYWGSLIKSIVSLFQSITGGVDWDEVARPLVEYVSPEMGILFVMYIGFTMFCMLNVVTGVFIESVMKNAQSENELRTLSHVMQLFSKLDVEDTGEISWEAFEKNLHRKEMHDFFKTIDVDIDNAHTLFELLDVDGSGSVDAQEFMDGCLRIWAPTKGLDLRMILRDVNKVLTLLTGDKEEAKPITCAQRDMSCEDF